MKKQTSDSCKNGENMEKLCNEYIQTQQEKKKILYLLKYTKDASIIMKLVEIELKLETLKWRILNECR